MIEDKHAGISCSECGYTKQVSNEEDAMKLENELEWFNGDAVCPECGASVWFEDYLEDDLVQEQILANSLYVEFKEVVSNQVSWTKWHIMELKNVTYRVAEKILLNAVGDGLVKPEDYHHRFVVINKGE